MAIEHRVEKRREQVSLYLIDGVTFEGSVFLAEYALNHSGGQTVADLLNEMDSFLPMTTASGEFRLVRKGTISHVGCLVALNQELDYTCYQVRISLPGNQVLEGEIKIDLPEPRSRLTDFLNSGHDFFPLFTADRTYLINRSLIRDIGLVD